MPKQISVNIGFVTNSSSVVHHFPRELLEHPKVKAFIEKFELQDGFVGEDLWNRDACSSFLVDADQKAEVTRSFSGDNDISSKRIARSRFAARFPDSQHITRSHSPTFNAAYCRGDMR